MSATLLIQLNRLESRPKQTCVQCGVVFLPHRVGDGAEELCVDCYRTRFETLSGRKQHTKHAHRHHAHPLGKTA